MNWRKVAYLLPWRRRAAEQDMQKEVECIAAMAEPGELYGRAMAMEAARQTWHWTAFDGFWADFRYAFRVLLRQPGLTAIAAASLALGMGANGAIFSFADAILFRPLPVAEPARLLRIAAATPSSQAEGISHPEARDIRSAAGSLAGLAAYRTETLGVAAIPGTPAQSRMVLLVNPEFFDTLGVAALHGSPALPERQARAVLAYEFWKSQFGGDPAAVGRSIRVNGVEFQISGVAPEAFTGMDVLFRPALYAPLSLRSQLTGATPDPQEDRERRDLAAMARVAPGAPVQAAKADVARAWAAIAREYPASGRNRRVAAMAERAFRIRQYPFRLVAVGSMAALTTIVLLIACVNVANLMLARSRARCREMAIRLAIGAGRLRLARQLLVESLAISALGGLAGLALARVIMRYLGTVQISSDLPISLDLRLDGRLLAFNAALCLCTCLLVGIWPARHAARTNLVSALKSGGGDGAGRRFFSGRAFSVIAQASLAVILLTVAGLYLNSSRQVMTSPARGFRTDHLISLEVDPVAARYSAARARDLYLRLRAGALSIPGVRSVALCESLPYAPNQSVVAVAPEGYQFPPGKEKDAVLGGTVDEQYFATLGVPILLGRGFESGDRAETRRVAVVNQEFARVYWPGRDPIGQRIRIDGADRTWEVAGVARNARYLAPSEPPRPYVYLPSEQRARFRMTLVAESAGDPADLAGPLRDTVRAVDPDLPMLNLRTLAAHEARTVENWFVFVRVLTGLGVMGLALALGGVYGLVSYSVSRRTAEIGIRMALGATPSTVVRMVVRQGMIPAVAGTTAGAMLSAVLAPRLAIGVQDGAAGQTLALIAIPVLLTGACALACYLPARRATRLAPTGTLRQD